MRYFIVLILALIPAFASAQAPSVSAAKTTLTQWFNGYEFVPSAADFKRVGPHLESALIGLVGDGQQPLHIRARAISALVYSPSNTASMALVMLAESTTAESLLRRKAVRVLGEVYQDRYVDLVVSVYDNAGADLPLKEACAKSLAAMPGQRAIAARAALHGKASNPLLRGALAPTKRINIQLKPTDGLKLPRHNHGGAPR